MKKLFILTILALCLFSPAPRHYVQAVDGYQLLAPIPLEGAGSGETKQVSNFQGYIPGVIKLVIGLAGAMAVLMLIFGGFQYIVTASGVGKVNARNTINNALIGFILAIGAYAILNTINPALVSFDFSHLSKLDNAGAIDTGLSNPDTPTPTPTPGGTVIPTGSCTNCALMPLIIPAKKATENGCALPGPCMLDATLIGKLQNMTTNMPSNINWRVTEMYPPTVEHRDGCHNNGTCADATVDNSTDDDVLLAFLKTVSSSGFTSYVYEVCDTPHRGFTTNRLSQVTKDPKLKDYWSVFKCYETTTAENVHVNM